MSTFGNETPGNPQDNVPSAFAVEGLKFDLVNAATAPTELYREMYGAALDSYNADLPNRSSAEVEELLGGSFERFAASRRDPQLVEGHPAYYPDLTFNNPRLVVAHHIDDESIAGYAYASENVSGGSPTVRRMKQYLTSRNFAFLREVVVVPSVPEVDIKGAPKGTDLAVVRLLMSGFLDRQPVSAFTWRENDRETAFASEIGLEPLGKPKPHNSFGDSKDRVIQQAWRGRVDGVASAIDAKPGAYEAFEHIQNNTRNLY
jgi:hypothetical protein